VTVYGPLFPRKTTKGRATLPLRAIRPRCTPRGGAVLRQTFGCPRELDVLLVYVGSRGMLSRVHDPVPLWARQRGSCTIYLSTRVIRPLNASLKWTCVTGSVAPTGAPLGHS
jgi:hypothetical protein